LAIQLVPNLVSTQVGLMADDSRVRQMEFGELCIALDQIQFDSARGLGRAATHLRQFIFEPVRQVDTCAMGVACDRIEDRLADAVNHTRHQQPRRAFVHIDLELNGLDQGFQPCRRHGVEHGPHSGHGFGLLAAHDLFERVALRLVGVFRNDQLPCAVALVDGSGPAPHAGCQQSVQLDVAEMPFIDLIAARRAAIAVRRQRVELARAAIVAVAVNELTSPDTPVNHDFILPLCENYTTTCK